MEELDPMFFFGKKSGDKHIPDERADDGVGENQPNDAAFGELPMDKDGEAIDIQHDAFHADERQQDVL